MHTDDLRINRVRPLLAPAILHEEIPVSARGSECVDNARRSIEGILGGTRRADAGRRRAVLDP